MRPVRTNISKEDLIRMREAGMGTVSIAKALGTYRQYITALLKKYGLPTALPTRQVSSKEVDEVIRRFTGRAA